MTDQSQNPFVSVVLGSASDADVADKAVEVLKDFNVPFEVGIKSAHRTPDRMLSYAKDLQGRGVKVVIAIAGGSAHLPGMIASETSIPVLAVPVKRPEKGHGDEALKSSIAMPAGIPLAVFPNNGADRAALFAIRMLALNDAKLQRDYLASQLEMKLAVESQDELIQKYGWEDFYNK